MIFGKPQTLKSLFVTLLLGGMLSCAGEKINPAPLPPNADPSAEISKTQDALQQAASNETNVLAPRDYLSAQESLDHAKRLRAKSGSPDKILHQVAMANAYLDHARQKSDLSRTSLGAVPELRKRAIEAKADQIYPQEFQKADHELMGVTSKVERGDTSSAEKNRQSIAQRYRDLEVNAITSASLGPSKTLLENAKKEDAHKWVPNTYSQATRDFQQVSQFIAQNPEDKAQIQNLAQQVQQEAQKTLDYTRQAKLIKSRPPEYTVSQLGNLQSELQKAEGQANAQGSQLQQLKSLQSMDQKFKAAQAMFDPREASVFRQGDNLIIRLKGLNFQKSKVAIQSNDYALLKKVEKVIQDFGGNSQVLVQGYTDSSGSRALNKRLSAKRAKSVKDFLVADNAVSQNKIKSIGMADKNPIATNNTKNGRALNRRVDVMIKPEATT